MYNARLSFETHPAPCISNTSQKRNSLKIGLVSAFGFHMPSILFNLINREIPQRTPGFPF